MIDSSHVRVRFLVPILLAATLAGCGWLSSPEADRAVRASLKLDLNRGLGWFRRPTVDADDVQPIVRRFYRKRRYQPAWVHGRGPNDDARALLEILREAGREGLEPGIYGGERLDSLMKEADAKLLGPRAAPRLLARLDLTLTRAFLAYGAHLSTGQVNPRAVPADWHIPPRRVDLDSILALAVGRHQVQAALAGLAPRDPHYARLRDALAQYRSIEANGGWLPVPGGAKLELGQRGPRVLRLRQRLAATGDLPRGAGSSPVFDRLAQAGVERFQARHGLEPDGVVGADDLRELNLPVAHRIRQIELNMERWRWMRPLGDRSIIVNIPAFTLEVVDGGRPVMTMKVVVGKRLNRTPIFSDEITYIVFNPYWNIPPKIAALEIVPEMQRNPDYLRQNDIRVYSDEGAQHEIDPASVDWYSLDPEHPRYTFRQDPGPKNAVGHVKFMCPNQFDVYLHDTPAGHLFNESERDFSHGCIRVEHPVELAVYLLRGRPGSGPDDIRRAFESESRDSSVKVPRPMPVNILYLTAWMDDRGIMQFRDDVYGLDQMFERVLRRAVPVAARIGSHRAPGAAHLRYSFQARDEPARVRFRRLARPPMTRIRAR